MLIYKDFWNATAAILFCSLMGTEMDLSNNGLFLFVWIWWCIGTAWLWSSFDLWCDHAQAVRLLILMEGIFHKHHVLVQGCWIQIMPGWNHFVYLCNSCIHVHFELRRLWGSICRHESDRKQERKFRQAGFHHIRGTARSRFEGRSVVARNSRSRSRGSGENTHDLLDNLRFYGCFVLKLLHMQVDLAIKSWGPTCIRYPTISSSCKCLCICPGCVRYLNKRWCCATRLVVISSWRNTCAYCTGKETRRGSKESRRRYDERGPGCPLD